ncbi:MAG: tripartite tricarboxylate transporter TctB family protein, partial [Ignavibacteriales bacterium]
EKTKAGAAGGVEIRRLSTFTILLAVYLYLLPRIGFLGLTPAFLLALSLLLGRGTIRDRAIVGTSLAAGVTLSIFILFTKGFRLMLP